MNIATSKENRSQRLEGVGRDGWLKKVDFQREK
jgi:hypothetical protein